MLKLLTYGTIFYLGYRWGTMTPEQRRQFLSVTVQRGKTQISKVTGMVIDENGFPVEVQTEG